MSVFKTFQKNERVRHTIRGVGTVEFDSPGDTRYAYVSFDKDKYGSVAVSKSDLWHVQTGEPLSAPAAIAFQKGDKVIATSGKSVIVGEVDSAGQYALYIKPEGAKLTVEVERTDWKIEKVFVFPTKQYALIRVNSDVFIRSGPRWKAALDSDLYHSEAQIRQHAANRNADIEIIFEGI